MKKIKNIIYVLILMICVGAIVSFANAADTTIPTVVISGISSGASYDEGSSITFTVYFDDETELGSVYLPASNITLNGFTATKSVTGTGDTRKVTLSNIKGSGTGKSITIAAGSAKDMAGNSSKAVTSRTFTINSVDNTAPTVTISNPSVSSVYNGETVKYTLTFSDNEAVSSVNISASSITLNGFTASVSISGSGNSQRTVTLTNINGNVGTNNYITVKAGVVVDSAGNSSSASSSSKFTIAATPIVDTTIPTVTISKPSESSVYSGGSVRYTVYFDDETELKTVNFSSSYVVLNGFTADVSVTGSEGVRVVTLTNIKGNIGTNNFVTIKAGAATDAAGNKTKEVNSRTFEIVNKPVTDTTIPTVAISKPSVQSVYAGETVSYTVYFNDETELKKIDFNESYVVLNGFTASVAVSGTGDTRKVTLTNIKGNIGTNNFVTIKAGAATDAAGNKTKEVTSGKFEIKLKDTVAPIVTISNPSVQSVYEGETVKYTVYFSDNVGIKTVNFNESYVVLNGFTANVSVSGNGNSQRTVTLTNIKGNVGTNNYITVKAGAVTDAAGNTSKLASSSSFNIEKRPVVDNTAPTIKISNPTPTKIYNKEAVQYTVYFEDDKEIKQITLNKNNIVLNGFTANVSVSGEGLVRIVNLTDIKGNIGTNNSITVLEGAAIDKAGNKTPKKTSSSFEIIKQEEPEKPVEGKDNIAPVVKILVPNPQIVKEGNTVKYNVTFSDNVKVTSVKLSAQDIKLIGFTAKVTVKLNGLKSATITLSNIKGNAGVNKYIKIASGVALDKAGNRSKETISMKFGIQEKAKTKVVTKYTKNCIDDLRLLGDINEEITYFASWLRAEKYTASYVQENNYVAEDETMTYMIEYYNGDTLEAKNVKFDLTIPYKVEIEEINGGGKISKKEDDETVISWSIGNVQSYLANKNQGYCRLYVRVRFLENTKLEESENISEIFYPVLKTTASEIESYSYMRQLFVDKTEGKIGEYKGYLTLVDTTNSARPDDEITRAELAKMLQDAGLLNIEIGSKDYKKYKDYEEIPSYARDAVSALYNTDIMQIYKDESFKPGNPLLMEDVMQTVAKAASYISYQKLTVYKPVFIYKQALTGKDKKISPKKDYIMELMRQNVVVKYESNPDHYALRKEVVAMLNSLTFRGPFVEILPENTLKFADLRDNSVFFYNTVGAINSYKYTYDYRLWQQIVEIE